MFNFLRHKEIEILETIDEIKERCSQTQRVTGNYRGADWSIELSYGNNNLGDLSLIPDSAARFNPASETLALWRTKKDLGDYLRKRQINSEYAEQQRAKGKSEYEIANYTPYSGQVLAMSCSAAFQFDLGLIHSLIDINIEKAKKESLEKTVLALWKSQGLQPCLLVNWNFEKKEKRRIF